MFRANHRTPRSAGEEPYPFDSSVELFEDLTEREIDDVRRYFTVIDVEPGAVLGREGHLCQAFTLILGGRVGIGYDASPVIVFDRGCFFGAVPLLDPLDRFRRGTATALDEARLAIANPREFVSMLQHFPMIDGRIRSTVARRRDALERIRTSDREIVVDVDYPVRAAV